jgi:hypothetical protein
MGRVKGRQLTHVLDVGRRSVWNAAFFNFHAPIRAALMYIVAEPIVHAIEKAVNPDAPPLLVEAGLVVHVEYLLQETAAQAPEIIVLVQFPPSDVAAARRFEGRAVGVALGLVKGQVFVDKDQRDGIVARHRACVVFHLAVIDDTHDLQCRPGSVIIRVIIYLAAGTTSVGGKEHTSFHRVGKFSSVSFPIRNPFHGHL